MYTYFKVKAYFKGHDFERMGTVVALAPKPFLTTAVIDVGDSLDGHDVNDLIWAGDGNDGGAGIDALYGNDGNDTLQGGTGNDILNGGAGRDTYLFNQGDGIDRIYDDDSGPEKSILVFGPGVDKDAIKLRTGSLLLDLGDDDAIHIENFDQANPLGTQSVASFQFADGTSLSWEQLLQRGFDLDGTEGDDNPLIGTGVADRIDGKGGNHRLWRLWDTGKTRRWQYGEGMLRAANEATWRRRA